MYKEQKSLGGYVRHTPIVKQGEAFISVKKNRVKTIPFGYVYLQDSQEFEIELFNPTTITKLAKITINGKSLSNSGIVLKPGQRVYLERYLDSSEKFLFQTYTVENSQEVLGAIEHNGDIKIEFYDEYQKPEVYYCNNFSYSFNNPDFYRRINDVYQGIGNPKQYLSNTNDITCSVTSLSSSTSNATITLDSLETGRVEKGSKSDQSFTNYQGSFNSHVSNTVRIKILPLSQKPLEAKDLSQYCTNCGTKNKKGWKFCPSCGNKY